MKVLDYKDVQVFDYKGEHMFGPVNDMIVQEGAVLRSKHNYSLVNTKPSQLGHSPEETGSQDMCLDDKDLVN